MSGPFKSCWGQDRHHRYRRRDAYRRIQLSHVLSRNQFRDSPYPHLRLQRGGARTFYMIRCRSCEMQAHRLCRRMLTATPQRRVSLVIESNTHILGETSHLLNSGMRACQRFSLTDLVDVGGQEQGTMTQTTTRCEVFTQERPVQIPIRSNDDITSST